MLQTIYPKFLALIRCIRSTAVHSLRCVYGVVFLKPSSVVKLQLFQKKWRRCPKMYQFIFTSNVTAKQGRGCIVNMKSCYKAAVYLQMKRWHSFPSLCFNVVSFWRTLKKKKYRSHVELITQGVNSEATSILCQVTQGIRHVKSMSTDLIYTKKKQEVVQLGVSVHIPYTPSQTNGLLLPHACLWHCCQ